MSTVPAEDALFDHAPAILGLVRARTVSVKRRALLLVLIAWLPLVLLALLQSLLLGTDDLALLLQDVGLHARYVFAVPLLILGEAVCVPTLNAIVHHLVASGIVVERDRGRVELAVRSTRRLLASRLWEIVVVVLAYAFAIVATWSQPRELAPGWAASGGLPMYSLAGWWHTLVSLPLLLILIFDWMWRVALWARLLRVISRLDLALVASHPDRCAGLGVLGESLRAFSIVALAFAAIVAGRSLQLVLLEGQVPTSHVIFAVTAMLGIVALLAAPVLTFVPVLMRTWQRRTLEYGVLADRLGHSFERKWLGSELGVDDAALDQPDFSATADLYSIVANVHAMRFVPIGVRDLVTLALAIVVPFVPVVLAAFPLEVLWAQTKNVLF